MRNVRDALAETASHCGEPTGVAMRLGNFEVLDTAGYGATGTVYRARDVRSGDVVAVKLLRPDAVAGLEQEAETLRRLQHPHLVRLLETGTTDDGRPWMAQAWVDGVQLDRLLQVHGTLSAEQAVGVLRGALEGLAHAHRQGVVHRDVAPANVLVDTAGTSMLVDFGVAAPVGATGVRGTPAFLSPEAAAGAAVGPASDVYSAGAVLHLLLAGRPVFPAADVAAALEAHGATPPPPLRGHGKGFAELLQRCLAKSADARPPDAGALLAELDEQAQRRFGAGWLGRASVAALVPAARAVGSGGAAPTASAARETVVLTTGAVSTGAAAVAAAPSTAPAAAPAPVQPQPPPTRGRRPRLPRSGLALAAAAAAAVVTVIAAGATAVIALTGDDTVVQGAAASPRPGELSGSASADPTPDGPSSPGSAYAEYAGTLRKTSGGDVTRDQPGRLRVSCSEQCTLTGPELGEGPGKVNLGNAHPPPIVLTPLGDGKFSINLPSGDSLCGPGDRRRAVTGSVVLSGTTMTLVATEPEEDCGDALFHSSEYTFTGRLVDGEPILE